jgi:hypothetical protein
LHSLTIQYQQEKQKKPEQNQINKTKNNHKPTGHLQSKTSRTTLNRLMAKNNEDPEINYQLKNKKYPEKL